MISGPHCVILVQVHMDRDILLLLLLLLEKWFPLQGERAQSLKVFNVRILGFKNKIEMRKRRQNNNRPINLPQGNNILYILHVHHLTQNFISRAYTMFNNRCVAMYVS